MTGEYAGRQIVGMDLHSRRSVLVRMSEDGRNHPLLAQQGRGHNLGIPTRLAHLRDSLASGFRFGSWRRSYCR